MAITRAKKALYVIGHLKTFKGNKDWKMFINHAEKQKVVVLVDRDMRCAQECLNRELTVSKSAKCVSVVEKSIELPPVPHRDHLILPSSMIPAGTVSFKEKNPAVDRSAFSSPRKSAKYVPPLPLSTKPAKRSTLIKSSTGMQKQLPGSSTEQPAGEALLDSPVTPSKTIAMVPAADKQKSFTDGSSTFETINTVAKKLCGTGISKNITQGLHSDHLDMPIPEVDNVSSSSHTSTKVEGAPSKSRVAAANATKHLDAVGCNVTWGGQRKRISHYTKRSHSDNVTSNSKRVKHSSFS